MRHIAVDLDGTLAHYEEWRGIDHIGAPVLYVLNAVKYLLAQGDKVTIFTARVSGEWGQESVQVAKRHIETWCEKYIGQKLDVTATKLGSFTEIWDDKTIGIAQNEGRPKNLNHITASVWREADMAHLTCLSRASLDYLPTYEGLTR